MPAVIESTLYTSPGGSLVAGSTQQNSREDLQLGYQVVLRSVHEATTYSWSLAFASDSPGDTTPDSFAGTESISALLAPEGSTSRDAKFNVDFEGAYLIRLVVDAGLATEDTQFIRCRVLSLFGALKHIAAGERRDEKGVIPVDATPEGWANDQNANFQRIGLLLRRLSASGRILYVDANRGRDSSADQDDYDNVIEIPGPEASRVQQTGMRLRAMAHGDFSSINEAITYANNAASRGEPAPSLTEPYYIFVRPGLYIEDLALSPFVHIIGEPGPEDVLPVLYEGGLGGTLRHPVTIRPSLTGGVGTHRFNPQGPWNTQQVILANLRLDNNQNTDQPVLDVQGGQVYLSDCYVSQRGDAVTQGEAIRCSVANVAYSPRLLIYNSVVQTTASTANRAAITFDADTGALLVQDSIIDAEDCQGVVLNESLYQTCSIQTYGRLTRIRGDQPFRGYGDSMVFGDCKLIATDINNPALNVTDFGNPPGSKAGDVTLALESVLLRSFASFETLGAAGATNVYWSNVTVRDALTGQRIRFPDAPGDLPDVFEPMLWSDSLRYVPDHSDSLDGTGASATIPLPNRLVTTTVQGAIDNLILALFPIAGSPFYSLTSAYNGLATLSPPVPGAGLGRNLLANHGAVQIQGATYPIALDNQIKSGGLQLEGMLDIGGFINGGLTDLVADIGHSEIGLIPDFTGAGPFVGLGRARWPNGVTQANRGFAAASIVAGVSNNPAAPSSNAPYNLHLRATDLRSSGTGWSGNVYMVGGSINDPTSAHHPGDIHIVGGHSSNPVGSRGDIFLLPGIAGTNGGLLWMVGPGGTTRTGVVGVNPYVGGQAGTLYVGTPAGVEGIVFTGAENLAAATALINANSRLVSASDDGTRLSLWSNYGPSGDVRVVGDSAAGALNTALGDLSTYVAGVYGNRISMEVPAHEVLRINGTVQATAGVISLGDVRFVNASRTWGAAEIYNIYSCQLQAGVDINIQIDAAMPVSRKLSFKDENGIAAPAQRIVITDLGGGTIDGLAALVLNVNYAAVTIYKTAAGNWSILNFA